MDILYIVGTGSTWDNNELRYSLRSIAKNGRNVDRVFLVGYKPDFVSKEVVYIPCDDPYPAKHKNILHKTICAVENSDISRHFLVSSDDHFYIKPTDFDALPVYYRNEEIPAVPPKGQQYSPYHLSLVATRNLLIQNALPVFQTNPHCNTHWDVDVFERYRYLFEQCFRLTMGGEMNCVMGNLLIKEGAEHVPFNDSKLGTKCNEKNMRERVGDANCISGVSGIVNTFLPDWLAREFPDKCRYEV
ncbi:MAG: hypothetical protein IJ882_08170 [Paludibacteraceae bacterium]|nr:hypothetical protein [Paludibacteraceae bacterium]MBR3647642.1 hypothetical protein [Paludibacteraceae bacterium]